MAQADVALILAVEDYANYRKIESNLAHANAIGEQLKTRDFDVTVVANPTNASARAALRDLNAKAANARIALVVLLGYGAAASGQTFFLPNNASIDRATDLLSRGLSLGNVAQIIGAAQTGAVCFLMSGPNFPKPVEGVDLRPQLQAEQKPSVAVAVSNSNKIPVSRMDAAAAQAAREVVGLLQSTPRRTWPNCSAHALRISRVSSADRRPISCSPRLRRRRLRRPREARSPLQSLRPARRP